MQLTEKPQQILKMMINKLKILNKKLINTDYCCHLNKSICVLMYQY